MRWSSASDIAVRLAAAPAPGSPVDSRTALAASPSAGSVSRNASGATIGRHHECVARGQRQPLCWDRQWTGSVDPAAAFLDGSRGRAYRGRGAGLVRGGDLTQHLAPGLAVRDLVLVFGLAGDRRPRPDAGPGTVLQPLVGVGMRLARESWLAEEPVFARHPRCPGPGNRDAVVKLAPLQQGRR